MRYFVTGGTGLIGRHLVPRLLSRGRVELLVRPSTRRRLAPLLEAWAGRGHLVIHEGDVTDPELGLPAIVDLSVDHAFHLAALYDLFGVAAALERVNVDGTRNLLDNLRRRGFGGTLHHLSSIAVAGDYEGTFMEAQLDAGQSHPHPYHRTKFASELLVRAWTDTPVRIYRPSAVVGHSKTGEMDRIDGPYFMFEAIDRLRRTLPRWAPLPGLAGAPIDMVPVDWVAEAIERIAHAPGHDGQTFHLTDPNRPTFADSFNLVADAACAPRQPTKRRSLSRLLPGAGDTIGKLGSAQFLRSRMMEDLGVPLAVQRAVNPNVTFDATNATAIAGLPPPQSAYVTALWDYYVRNLASSSDPKSARARFFANKKVLVTGASSGIGLSLSMQLAGAGAEVILVARREAELAQVTKQIRDAGGRASYLAADLADLAACDRVVEAVLAEHGHLDVLVNNAGRSIRRSLVESLDRFHDLERVMQINFYAPARLIRGFLPSMVARRSGHVVNVLSAGTHMPSPRFGAYTASKAALSQLGDTLAAEHAGDDIRVTQAYLHWVRTPMMEATGAFEDNDAATPDEAAAWILDGVAAGASKLLRGTDRRRFILNQVAPRTLTRLVNLVYRVYGEDPEKDPELALDRSLAKRLFSGRPM